MNQKDKSDAFSMKVRHLCRIKLCEISSIQSFNLFHYIRYAHDNAPTLDTKKIYFIKCEKTLFLHNPQTKIHKLELNISLWREKAENSANLLSFFCVVFVVEIVEFGKK